ncbi:hypothetical protein BMW24_004715 [Mycobacterium heckeshornense]|nr:hypothetical protein ACT16_20600 [Mycobacterium heckeshornense]PIJ36990.1 hypothetical protein BMW24_004715 [Mycobacterium heckeshornense]
MAEGGFSQRVRDSGQPVAPVGGLTKFPTKLVDFGGAPRSRLGWHRFVFVWDLVYRGAAGGDGDFT